MYFLPCQQTLGYDTVFRQKIPRVKPGDLIHDASGAFLCLGETIAFPALYPPTAKHHTIMPLCTTNGFVSGRTLDLVHRLSQTYYAPYKSIGDLFQRKLPTAHTKYILQPKMSPPQHCYLFPDLRSLMQHAQEVIGGISKSALPPSIAVLHGGLTITQKAKIYAGIRLGTIHTLYATNRGLFFDRANLQSITIFDPHARAYSNQSDPRFVMWDVVQQYAMTYGATVISH